jgi:lactate dehydrogenase-like 2-hydroxyacid dehydrogenase
MVRAQPRGRDAMDKPTVLVLTPVPQLVQESCDRYFDAVKLAVGGDRDAVLAEHGPRIRGIVVSGRSVDGALMDRLPALEIVSSFGVGYDNVDARHAASRGVVVTNTPDVLTEEVADTALALLLATVRQIPQAERYLRAGRWRERAFPLTEATLRDRSLGILGLGRIGKAIARRCEAFGLPISYHGRRPQEDVPYRYYDSLVGLARAVDTLMVIAPGGPETYHIVNAEVLEALGPRGILINVGRGTVVDEQALIHALQNKVIFSAGLDVFENEPHVPEALIAMEHIVLLPHVGSASVYTRRAMAQLVVDNIVNWFDKGEALTPVTETAAHKQRRSG